MKTIEKKQAMAISTNPLSLSPGKLFIKPLDRPEANWQELTGEIVTDSITTTQDTPDPYHPTRLRFKATLHINRKDKIRLLQTVGLLKRPRVTYKTMRRDRAKRNI